MLVVTTQCFPPRLGGIEGMMQALAGALHTRGVPLEVWADATDRAADASFDAGSPLTIRRFGGLKPWRRWRKGLALTRAMQRGQVDAVLADTWKSLEKLSIHPPRAVMCLAHGSEFPPYSTRTKRARIALSLGKASLVIANSAYTASLVRPLVTARTRVEIIHPGITKLAEPSTAARARADVILQAADPILISVARLEPRKGIDTMLKILPQLIARYPKLCYIIVGHGRQHATLEALVAEQNLGAHVKLTGAIDSDLRNALLARSHLFVLPGRVEGADIEGFGLAYVEAGWFGVPAIAGRAGGANEAVIHEQTGLVCDGANNDAVMNAVDALLADDSLRERYGQAAHVRAEQLLWEWQVEHYLPYLPDQLQFTR